MAGRLTNSRRPPRGQDFPVGSALEADDIGQVGLGHGLVPMRHSPRQHLRQLAAQFGVPIDQISALLAQHLPNAVDQASPNGTLAPSAPKTA